MANKTSIVIKSVGQDNKPTSRSITDVSRTASDVQLKNFAEALNNTSSNTYVSSTRVQTTDLDTSSEKQSRTMTLLKVNDAWDEVLSTVTSPIVFNSIPVMTTGGENVDSYVLTYENSSITGVEYQAPIAHEDNKPAVFTALYGYGPGGNTVPSGQFIMMVRESDFYTMPEGKSYSITLHVAEDDTYQEADFVVTLQGGNS